MPISDIQSSVLQIIARHRDPESFIAGGLAINRDGPRFSEDIDIFHDAAERVAIAAEHDAQALRNAGYGVEWVRRLPALYTAIVKTRNGATHLDWVTDSDFRFFPAVPDAQFGYVLHIADLAVSKLMAAVGRREPRDAIDLLTIDEKHLSLGAVAWAAAEAAPGFTPEGLLAELSRTARFTATEFRSLSMQRSVDPAGIARRLKAARERAEAFLARMPSAYAGALFIRDGKPVQPDPLRLDTYVLHRAKRRGHWPTSSEIGTAMIESFAPPPTDDRVSDDSDVD